MHALKKIEKVTDFTAHFLIYWNCVIMILSLKKKKIFEYDIRAR